MVDAKETGVQTGVHVTQAGVVDTKQRQLKIVSVMAVWIDPMQFGYICPNCWTRYKKNGQPHANAKRVQHVHGSCGDLKNRVESRVPHCPKSDFDEVVITIDDTTIRRSA